MPSSPNGPCRTGSTTSTAPSASAGSESASTGSVSETVPFEQTVTRRRPFERPAAVAADRDRASPRSAPGRAPPATERADASEISCSLERPPASTATRIRLTAAGRVSWSAEAARRGGAASKRPTTITHRRPLLGFRAARRILREHDPVAELGRRRLLDHLAPRSPTSSSWRACSDRRLARHVRDLRRRRALRDLERDHVEPFAAAAFRRPGSGRRRSPPRRRRRRPPRATAKPAALQLRLGGLVRPSRRRSARRPASGPSRR